MLFYNGGGGGVCLFRSKKNFYFCDFSENKLQNKQEERRLKRIEGDIVKKQRLLRRVMHDYENGKLKNNS